MARTSWESRTRPARADKLRSGHHLSHNWTIGVLTRWLEQRSHRTHMTGWGNVARAAIAEVLPTFGLTRGLGGIFHSSSSRRVTPSSSHGFLTCVTMTSAASRARPRTAIDYARRIGWGIGPRLSHVVIVDLGGERRTAPTRTGAPQAEYGAPKPPAPRQRRGPGLNEVCYSSSIPGSDRHGVASRAPVAARPEGEPPHSETRPSNCSRS